MKRKTRVHKDKDTGEFYLKLRSVLYGTGIKAKDVFSYKIVPFDDDQGFILELYDKDNNNIALKE